FAALLPQRVVIVFAVEAELVERLGIARQLGGAPLAWGIGRRTPLPNMHTLLPSCLVTNSSSSIASSGVCTGITAAGVRRSSSPLKESAVTTLKPRMTARRVAASAMRGM